MEARISIITLGVRDMDAARKFYVESLGWPELDRGGPSILFIELGPAQILAFYPVDKLAEDAGKENPEVVQFSGVTLAQNVGSEEAVRETMLEAEAAGAKIVVPAEEVFWGGYRGYFEDPNGHLWEVAYNPFWKELTGEGQG